MNAVDKALSFKKLHESGCFVLPNPWDRGTALFLKTLGFKALATTSAGLSFTKGLQDQAGILPINVTLANVRTIVQATDLPVNADFQDGYAVTSEGVGENVELCIAAGAAGLSIEDASGDPAQLLYPLPKALERLRAARAAIDQSGVPVVLTGRCEAWLVGDATPFETALQRLVAYADSGADCLYAPGVKDPEQIAAIVKAVSPKPVNVLVSSHVPGLSLSHLAELGVRRVSVGSALARVAWGAFMRAARGIAADGSFAGLDGAVTFAELNGFLGLE